MKYELTGRLLGCSVDYKSGKPILSLEIDEIRGGKECYENLSKHDKLAVNIDKYRSRRSLNANNYAWKLITEIANKLSANKDDIYLEMLKRYGQSEMISVAAEVPIASYFKYWVKRGESKLNGKTFVHYRIYKGSSEFDTKEMSVLIEGLTEEAKALGIPTLEEIELKEIVEKWQEYHSGG